jgi:hypothetical protein
LSTGLDGGPGRGLRPVPGEGVRARRPRVRLHDVGFVYGLWRVTNSAPNSETADDGGRTRTGQASERYPGAPLWVKVFAIVVVVLVLLVAVVVVAGLGGPHGPMRHAPSSSGGDLALAV